MTNNDHLIDYLNQLEAEGDQRSPYEQHTEAATYWLGRADRPHAIRADRDCVAIAQVHATLAIAAALADMADSGIEYP